jgi:hypothetical protein
MREAFVEKLYAERGFGIRQGNFAANAEITRFVAHMQTHTLTYADATPDAVASWTHHVITVGTGLPRLVRHGPGLRLPGDRFEVRERCLLLQSATTP